MNLPRSRKKLVFGENGDEETERHIRGQQPGWNRQSQDCVEKTKGEGDDDDERPDKPQRNSKTAGYRYTWEKQGVVESVRREQAQATCVEPLLQKSGWQRRVR